MAIRNIKDIHNRILANYGESDPSAPTINGALVRHHPDNFNMDNVTHIRTGGAVEQTLATESSVPVIDGLSVEGADGRPLDAAAQISEENTNKDVPEPMHFMTWEIELGARIYKVPEGKLAALQNQPHADRLKLFDNLEKAKAEANAIFERVATKRTAKGLPRSILEPILEDFKRWDETNVPQYFL